MEPISQHSKELRMSVRVPAHLSVTIKLPLRIGDESVQAVSRNLSFDGALIQLNNPTLQKGTQVRVHLEAASKDPLVIDALVARCTSHGVALMFTEYSNEVLEFLSAILAAEYNKYLDSRAGPDCGINAVPFP